MTPVLALTDIEQFRTMVTCHLGLQYEDGKLDYLADVMRQRMQSVGRARFESSRAYLVHLNASPKGSAEWRALAEQLTVNETFFFRNSDNFLALGEIVLPERIRAKAQSKQLRILSAGCSSGDEPYSLAIMLREALPDLDAWDVKIIGIDINPAILLKATRARYSEWSLRSTSEDRRRRYFLADSTDFVLVPEIQNASALNLKLLNPREVCDAAVKAHQNGHAPLQAVEGFVRQILGWREYVRGIYWTHMPDYLELNTSNAQATLPDFYWTEQTDMACLRDAIVQTLSHGYAHHIQRLMVTGLYALLLGVAPKQVHAWYLGVYVDAVEWVELPNTLGMSQFADGGLMASKPYVASGKYIDRMSNHCKACKFNPAESTGDTACPFTTMYWDYLNRHADSLAKNPRMLMQLKNLNRLTDENKQLISEQASKHRLSVQ